MGNSIELASYVVQVALFGVMVCTIAATALTVAPGFRPDRTGFGRRFLFFFLRYCLPAWGLVELAVWALTGRPYP